MAAMNPWLWSVVCLLAGLFICGLMIVRSRSWWDGLLALEMAGLLGVLLLLLIAIGTHRPELYDIALTSAILSFPGALVFVRFGDRHGQP